MGRASTAARLPPLATSGSVSSCRRRASGARVAIRTVSAPTASTRETAQSAPRALESSVERARSSDSTTAAASRGEPSWNVTPGRRVKSQVVSSGVSHRIASDGRSWRLRSYATRGSKTFARTARARGSLRVGSSDATGPCRTTRTGPCGAGAPAGLQAGTSMRRPARSGNRCTVGGLSPALSASPGAQLPALRSAVPFVRITSERKRALAFGVRFRVAKSTWTIPNRFR